MHSLRSNSTITHQVRMSYFELVQVGGALPVFVVADARHAGKSDGDAISGVHLGFGELGACDLPNRGLLQQTTHSSSSSETVTDKANTHTASPINASRVTLTRVDGGGGREHYCLKRDVCVFPYRLLFPSLQSQNGSFQSTVFLSQCVE